MFAHPDDSDRVDSSVLASIPERPALAGCLVAPTAAARSALAHLRDLVPLAVGVEPAADYSGVLRKAGLPLDGSGRGDWIDSAPADCLAAPRELECCVPPDDWAGPPVADCSVLQALLDGWVLGDFPAAHSPDGLAPALAGGSVADSPRPDVHLPEDYRVGSRASLCAVPVEPDLPDLLHEHLELRVFPEAPVSPAGAPVLRQVEDCVLHFLLGVAPDALPEPVAWRRMAP